MFNSKFQFCLWIFLLGITRWSFAQEVTVQVRLNTANVKKATQAAIQDVSMEIMERLIEPAKLKAQKKQIQKLILTRYNRYIIYTKTSVSQAISSKKDMASVITPSPGIKVICPDAPSQSCLVPVEKDYFVISVTIGFSEQNLKKILLEEDLFYSGVFNQRILPLVFFDDSVNRRSYGWWMKKNKNFNSAIHSAMKLFYNQIQDELMSYGFYLVNPEFTGSVHFIPKQLKFNRYKKRNIFAVANFFQAPLVLTGLVKISESSQEGILNLKIQLGVYHTKSGRLLAEVEQLEKLSNLGDSNTVFHTWLAVLKTRHRFIKGLSLQLQSLYESGRISSELVSITINGYLTYQQFNKFQKQLVSQISSIQGLQENLIRHRSITFRAHTTGSVEAVAKEIKNNIFSQFTVSVSRIRKNEIILSVAIKKLN